MWVEVQKLFFHTCDWFGRKLPANSNCTQQITRHREEWQLIVKNPIFWDHHVLLVSLGVIIVSLISLWKQNPQGLYDEYLKWIDRSTNCFLQLIVNDLQNQILLVLYSYFSARQSDLPSSLYLPGYLYVCVVYKFEK